MMRPIVGGLYMALDHFGPRVHSARGAITVDELFVVTNIDETKYMMRITCFSQSGKTYDSFMSVLRFGEMAKRVG